MTDSAVQKVKWPDPAKTTHAQVMQYFFNNVFPVLEQKSKDYGDSWKQLGALSLYVEMHAKWQRLTNIMWRGAETTVEEIAEINRDMAMYGGLMMLCLRDDNLYGLNYEDAVPGINFGEQLEFQMPDAIAGDRPSEKVVLHSGDPNTCERGIGRPMWCEHCALIKDNAPFEKRLEHGYAAQDR